MDVREKLVELMKEVKYSVFPNSTDHYTFGVQHSNHVFRQVADHLIVHGATVQEWISVKDRLPEEEGLYLVAVVNDHERRYSKTAWYHGRENWFSNQKVTHWMPLPEPPTE